jgi:hypothetical protein
VFLKLTIKQFNNEMADIIYSELKFTAIDYRVIHLKYRDKYTGARAKNG